MERCIDTKEVDRQTFNKTDSRVKKSDLQKDTRRTCSRQRDRHLKQKGIQITDVQTSRQTDNKQKGRQTDKHMGRQTNIQMEGQTAFLP